MDWPISDAERPTPTGRASSGARQPRNATAMARGNRNHMTTQRRVFIAAKRPNANGFTLPEVVVATLLFGVASLAVFALTTSLIRMNAFSSEISLATSYAESKIEEMHGMLYSNVTNGSDTVNGYSRSWTVNTNWVANTKVANVTVTWTGAHKTPKSTTIRTVINDAS